MLLFGETSINKIFLGDTNVSAMYLGDEKIYGEDSIPAVKFTAVENNCSIGLEQLSTNQQLWYSTDGQDWNTMTIETAISLVNSGDCVYIRGILNGNNTSEDYTSFSMTGKIAARGNANYLWNYENPGAPLKEYCGCGLFYGCPLLTTAPDLPATTLTEGCYAGMFFGCGLLTTAPELPATTLANSCYYGMFYSCISLTTAPELPATTLVGSCYRTMFYGCTNLNYIKCLATDISANQCTTNWVDGVAQTGTFLRDATTSWPSGTSGIPSGWDVEDY